MGRRASRKKRSRKIYRNKVSRELNLDQYGPRIDYEENRRLISGTVCGYAREIRRIGDNYTALCALKRKDTGNELESLCHSVGPMKLKGCQYVERR